VNIFYAKVNTPRHKIETRRDSRVIENPKEPREFVRLDIVYDNRVALARTLASSPRRRWCSKFALEVRAFSLEEVSMHPEHMMIDLCNDQHTAKGCEEVANTMKNRSPPAR
jgi:hypothetical protein